MFKQIRALFLIATFIVAFNMNTLEVYAAGQLPEYESTLINKVNYFRERVNLGELSYDSKLQKGADIRAKEAYENWSHTRPDGTEYWTADPNSAIYGENMHKVTTGYVVSIAYEWYKSPTHKEVMLADDFKTCAVGQYKAPDGYTYTVMEFGY